ncbi:MAG: 1-acyl-sn-glycerol-3-phosphate acyltransferase [Selenomonadaceae bacterium]|nr:1-acyl-sn-glycerol-3-phosphate acyltransferase [Selenomonadaceae bacterium]MBR4695766.1 1-acyl-sn-glycerol-3-phosphate acyltransferase [Selenomonadaceae bacterium]MBR6905916.1 1-acyl-sn-glycerol-3-phosphate acyltransferase [Selenomonadaceae bacterium]
MLYALARCFFVPFFKIFFRARVLGAENLPAEGPVILAANHLSNWDPPFLACFLPRPVSYMAKIELFKNPVFAAAIRSCHAFPVKRGAADRGAIKTAMQVLKEERVLGVFPEGTRSRTGKMQKAEAGVALIASMSDAPVVPAAILGTNEIFSKGRRFPKLTIAYGKPMKFTGNRKNKEDLEEFSQSILNIISDMKEKVK